MKEESKVIFRAVLLLGCVGLLAGCSTQSMTLSSGPLHEKPKNHLRSIELNTLLKTNYEKAYEISTNKLGTQYDLEYAGPCAVLSHEEFTRSETGNISESKEVINQNSLMGLGGQAMTSFGPGMAAPILGLILQAGATTPQANPVPLGYDHLVNDFGHGEIFWVARYVQNEHNLKNHIDKMAHTAILWAGDLNPAGWASGTSSKSSDAIYRINNVVWRNWADANVQWGWEGYKNTAPVISIVPTRMDWIVQSWKHPKKNPFYLVNPKKSTYPFMYLTSIEYRIQPGFNVPKWIQNHKTDLSSGGWMVIYHQIDHAVVWQGGQTHAYPEPKDLALKKS